MSESEPLSDGVLLAIMGAETDISASLDRLSDTAAGLHLYEDDAHRNATLHALALELEQLPLLVAQSIAEARGRIIVLSSALHAKNPTLPLVGAQPKFHERKTP